MVNSTCKIFTAVSINAVVSKFGELSKSEFEKIVCAKLFQLLISMFGLSNIMHQHEYIFKGWDTKRDGARR